MYLISEYRRMEGIRGVRVRLATARSIFLDTTKHLEQVDSSLFGKPDA